MTAQHDEWGPWQLHDGKGCPCVGTVIMAVWMHPDGGELFVANDGDIVWLVPPLAGSNPQRSSWWWSFVDGRPVGTDGFNPIIRYRIRKPRALLDLIQMVADLPAPVKTDGVIA